MTKYSAGKPDPADLSGGIWGLDGRAPFASKKYNNQASFRQQLKDMGIDPYVPSDKPKIYDDEDEEQAQESLTMPPSSRSSLTDWAVRHIDSGLRLLGKGTTRLLNHRKEKLRLLR